MTTIFLEKNVHCISVYRSVALCAILINLFIYLFMAVLVFAAVCRLSLVAVSGGYSSLWCVGFSLQWLPLLRSMGSSHAAVSSCGTWTQ